MRALVLSFIGALVVGCGSRVADDSAAGPAPASPLPSAEHMVSRGAPPEDAVKHDVVVDAVARLQGRLQGLGLEAIKDGAAVDVGDAIPVYEAQAAGGGVSIGDRLGEPDAFLVPIRTDGQVVTGITMRRDPAGTWDVVTVGRVGLVRAVERVRARLSAEGHDPAVGLVMVHGPEMRLLVREEVGKRVFTSLGGTSAARLPVEEDVEEARVNAELAAEAAR